MNHIKFKFIVLLCLISVCASAQNIAVKGVVKDTSGEPIIGASVLEKGTTNGIITDLDGNFSLQAKKGSVLVVSFIGYKTQEVTVNSVQSLKITLLEDSKTLDEVVVIGYGTQRKEAVTGSVASMRGDDLRQIPTGNVTAALQNRVAGVEMTQTSSKPGAGMQIRIRGVRSLSASNDPLIVLDGIPFAGSINDIDPNSIKSLDILKDASATAIYGSRGANGVILITSIRGNAGQKPQVTYNGYYGIKNAIEFPMMNGPEFAELRRQAARTIKDLGLSASPVTNSEDESDETNTNYQDLMYRTGVITNHDINVSKGTDDGNYAFGASYYLDQAPIPTQQYSRLALRASVDQKLGKYMKVGLSSNSSYSLSQGSQINTGDALASSPLSNPYNEDGTIKRAVKSGPTDVYKVWTKDLLQKADDKWMSDTKSFASYNSLYGEVSTPWIEGLKYRINIGLNVRTTKGGGFTGIGVTSTTDPNAPSSASADNTLTTNWAVENMLTYDRTFNKHNINVVALYSAEQTHYDRTNIAVRDLPADHFQYYDLSKAEGEVTITPNNQGYYESGLMSYMGRAMYSYDDRYMASVTFRADASSRLAKGHQWHSYPAVSLGWNLHKESFMQDFGWLDQLKLRVGYGETSNQSVNPYQTLGLLGTNKYNFGTTYLTGYELSQLPNPKLGWEYTTTWNYGLNFSLFGNRLSGTIEYYSQHTKDILLSVNLPSTSGVGSYMANIGETQNRGFEISLNGVILENVNGWTWEAGVNFSHNQNELLSLASGQDNDEGNWWFKGHPINVIYDYQKIGIWQENDPYRNILEPGGNAGMIKVKYTGEYAEDGTPVRQINTDDRQIIEVDPNFQGGFNTRVAYKNWDLSIVGGFQNGGTLISTLYGGTSYLNMLNGRHGNVKVDYWTPENTGAKYPRPGGITSADNMKYANSMAMFSGSYMKVRTITVGYNVPKSFLEHLGVNDLRLYATVQNPFVFFSPYNNETGMDPEPNSLANENQAVTTQYPNKGLVVVGYNTPATRNFLFGLKLTF
ncbi:TonB-dependent receptor [Bacteroides graminisolvens]|uniref:SusC/RagA family TonB-linked outer membrane protein n=1 Tax=Bacteroides graminisolvens TaxID=477666 RepID=UPI0029C6D669|nr:TonB-dependent receptor [Bacteroides graminisolvens]